MALSNPKISLSITGAPTPVLNQPQKVLLIGQMTSAGSATAGALVQDIGNESEENALFGENSMLAEMVRAFKRINQVSRLDAIPLDDNGSGVAATATITFTATPTATGSLNFYIGSKINHIYTIPVALTDTATTLAGALEAAINADTQAPVTANNVAGVLTLTAVNAGTVGNGIGIAFDGLVAGVSVVTTAMASGATDPSLTGLFDPVASIRYQTVIYPTEYTLTTLTSFLNARFNVYNNILDGVGIITKVDSYANIQTLANAQNTQSLVIIGNQLINRNTLRGGAIFELSYVTSTEFGAVRALRLTQDANISQYVIGGSSRDQFGGAAIASLPYFNSPFYNLPLILPGDEWTQLQVDALLTAGAMVLGNNSANNLIIAGQAVTTYKTDAGGNPDPSYKFLNYVDTMSNIREYMFNNAKADYRQSRLTEGDLIPNRKMANQGSIAASFTGYYQTLAGVDYVLVQSGESALRFFKQNLSVTLDLSLGKVSLSMKTPIVTQLREIIGTVQLSFSTNS